jgi:hypothetical protein
MIMVSKKTPHSAMMTVITTFPIEVVPVNAMAVLEMNAVMIYATQSARA